MDVDGSPGTDDTASARPGSETDPVDRDVASLRQAIARVDSLPQERRRFLTSYAYVLVRIARVDAEISDAELARIEESVVSAGDLAEADGTLIVSLASKMSQLFGATEDYAFTRDFARSSSPQQRQRLLRSCVMVGTADGSMAAAEIAELHEIGLELGFAAEEVDAIREQMDPAAGHR
jgi:tellurite resistance protein